jgi:hypothetical protein
VESRDVTRAELVTVAPLVLVILGLGVYPHFVVSRTEHTTVHAEQPAAYLVWGHASGAQVSVSRDGSVGVSQSAVSKYTGPGP